MKSFNSKIQYLPNDKQPKRLLEVDAYKNFTREVYERCCDLYLRPLVQWISSIDVHPTGEHVIAGSYDGRSFWFDTELKSEPYKVLSCSFRSLAS